MSNAIEVALTVDDLTDFRINLEKSNYDYAEEFITILKNGVVADACGFVIGSYYDTKPDSKEILKLWGDAGYIIGNHTYSHIPLRNITVEDFEKDVKKNDELLNSHSFYKKLFRYPELDVGESVEKANAARNLLTKEGYRIAEASLSFYEYLWNEPYMRCQGNKAEVDRLVQIFKENVRARIEETVRFSEEHYGRRLKLIFVMHPSLFFNQVLPETIEYMKELGVKFISLEDALLDPIYLKTIDNALDYHVELKDIRLGGQGRTLSTLTSLPMKELSEIGNKISPDSVSFTAKLAKIFRLIKLKNFLKGNYVGSLFK